MRLIGSNSNHDCQGNLWECPRKRSDSISEWPKTTCVSIQDREISSGRGGSDGGKGGTEVSLLQRHRSCTLETLLSVHGQTTYFVLSFGGLFYTLISPGQVHARFSYQPVTAFNKTSLAPPINNKYLNSKKHSLMLPLPCVLCMLSEEKTNFS